MVHLSHSLVILGAVFKFAPLSSALSITHRRTPVELVPRQITEPFTCEYPPGWTMCNTPENRACWVIDPNGKEYNISSDYETQIPQGRDRELTITLSEKEIAPDGIAKLAKLIDGKYPGTLIEACWGDTLVVNVKNELPTNGTTIHWHGIRQLNSNQMDGVNGVTQCPTAQGETLQYKFRLTQYGHTWYHSHYSSQYSDGVAAPMLIHGPHSANWIEEFPPMIVSDWIHNSAFTEFSKEMDGDGSLPQMDSILVDGVGKYKTGGSLYTRTFEAGKKYLIRIINGSTGLHFHWSLDNHVLTVVSIDFVAVQPFQATHISVGIGQRYGVIIEAKPTTPSSNGKYWMRTEYAGGLCNTDITGVINTDRDGQRTGIFSYSDAGSGDPTTTRFPYTPDCNDVQQTDTDMIPVVPWRVTVPQNDINGNTYEAGLDTTQSNEWKWHNAFQRWSILDQPMWLDMANPTILNMANETWNPEYDIVKYDYNPDKGFVYMIISSGGIKDSTSAISRFGSVHPIHLHGHDFAIIGQGTTTYDPDTSPSTFILDNPPRRDVAMLPSGGYLAIAFKPDNPGAWILHCHIAWHAGSGLALQVLERQSEVVGSLGGAAALQPLEEGCASWKGWVAKNPIHQEDSGV
ncbi:multicopper oxidase [Pleomassaria siparia CBS 279.74]|uniref:Multicopper oxidase n=1 Tax=Pleomassaria siparia CBS 279.74 TaxID=1314801 RepID=A0A6G1K5K9_9PLEO|nr:multicopper oxidase [Pleomassaria siparia CBS 279.74]